MSIKFGMGSALAALAKVADSCHRISLSFSVMRGNAADCSARPLETSRTCVLYCTRKLTLNDDGQECPSHRPGGRKNGCEPLAIKQPPRA